MSNHTHGCPRCCKAEAMMREQAEESRKTVERLTWERDNLQRHGTEVLTRAEQAETHIAALLEDVGVLLDAFDAGLFVRNTKDDADSAWAIKLLRPLAAMGRLANARKRPEGSA